MDDALVNGIVAGGIQADTEIYDWTVETPGLKALVAHEHNEAEARHVAGMIEQRYRADPRRKIYLTGHSGGSGIAVFALERLPDDVMVDDVVLLASALSPGYDLSKALAHVRGHLYNFYSASDPVLGYGTRYFGTIDGVKTEAAGRVGFDASHASNRAEYRKLMEISYDPAWMQLNNAGDHVGPMHRKFARVIIGPLLKTGELPVLAPASGSRDAPEPLSPSPSGL
jgi:pimeloyl-ACP methyl ester carboxylesterase